MVDQYYHVRSISENYKYGFGKLEVVSTASLPDEVKYTIQCVLPAITCWYLKSNLSHYYNYVYLEPLSKLEVLFYC